jgi:chemotaxis protein MotB
MSEGHEGGPIIVRKKRGGGEDDHHGGVWKLAFADFMTAMMAFFLVMWLINSTSKETKAVIVQYFNPVQLIDANPAHKGLRDPTESGQGKSLQHTDIIDTPSENPGKEKESALHKDPIKALDQIAQLDAPPAPADGAPPPPNAGAPVPRDPFDRVARSAADAPATKPEKPTQQEKAEKLESAEKPEMLSKAKVSAAALQAEIEKIVGVEASGLRATPKVEVRQVEEGVLISLTDDANFSMFAVGSIEPKPQLVRIIAQVGKILEKQHGEVEVRGHTDGRSYNARSYDNWRLSSDRATIVNYMLVRGGLAPNRVGKVVGYADHKLKTPKDPLAPVNRRIEILLRSDG